MEPRIVPDRSGRARPSQCHSLRIFASAGAAAQRRTRPLSSELPMRTLALAVLWPLPAPSTMAIVRRNRRTTKPKMVREESMRNVRALAAAVLSVLADPTGELPPETQQGRIFPIYHPGKPGTASVHEDAPHHA